MVTYAAVFALVLAYVALVAAYIALRTLAKVRHDTRLLARGTRGPNGRQSLLEITSQHAELTAALGEQVEQLRGEIANVAAEHVSAETGALRHVALVRYDAFTEMSGRMSFSLALLDDAGDGVTITAMTGRTDTRVYAKAVVDGKGEHELSPEERQAVAAARNRKVLKRAG
jgi:hypothetical protein